MKSEGTRIPETINGIQVNFCKNPRCPNYGVPASTEKQPRGPGAAERGRDTYTVKGTLGHGSTTSCLFCSRCNEYPSLKSNLVLDEEMKRMLRYLAERSITCPNADCDNHEVDVRTDRSGYQAFGRTKAGSQRYRCKLCQITFIAGAPKAQHRKPHKNLEVFRLLVNKMPLKRICEAADISMPTLYDKIDFIHQQCLAFAASRERKLLEGMPVRRLYVAVDRQDYLVNWTQTEDKRNIVLNAVGSADNTTGYVFGLHLNFDPSFQWLEVERDAIESGDYEKRYPFRKYARLWLQQDYKDAMDRGRMRRFGGKSLDREIESTYREAVERDDVEVSEAPDETTKLPSHGIQIHSEYTLYGHFFFLRQLLSGVEKVRFFLDQESGIRAACLSAFVDRIKEARCDAFYVRISKELTIDEKKKALAESRKEWNLLKRVYPKLSDSG